MAEQNSKIFRQKSLDSINSTEQLTDYLRVTNPGVWTILAAVVILLTGQDPDWLMPFIGVMSGLSLLQIIVAWAQKVYNLKINGKMSVIGSTTYMWKVLSDADGVFLTAYGRRYTIPSGDQCRHRRYACQHLCAFGAEYGNDVVLPCTYAQTEPFADSCRYQYSGAEYIHVKDHLREACQYHPCDAA